MYTLSFSSFLFIILCILSYQKFYVKAKNAIPEKDYVVVIDQQDNKKFYMDNVHLDGNLDGKITVGEQRRAAAFIQKSLQNGSYKQNYEFISKLDALDRRLVQGLTFDVARKAVHLPIDKKYELANFNVPLATKVNKINGFYRN